MTTLTLEPMVELDGMEILLNVNTDGVKVTDWIEQSKMAIEEVILSQGVLLIRGLNILSSKQFGKILTSLFGEDLAAYRYRSTPRTELKGNVYTATEYHANETISQHNESSYANKWAMRLGFLCMLPAQEGGATPLSDSRKVYQRIPQEIRRKFEEKQIMYVRNYGDIDLPWSEVFQTEERLEVEAYCNANNIQFEWKDNNGLRTKQVNPAVAVHPTNGEKVWFNQAHLFHFSALADDTRKSMLSVLGEDSLPRNACFGDGSAIDEADLAVIRKAYEQETVSFQWQAKDLLLLDNMMFTHGRTPYKGNRKVLVAMARGHAHYE